jgi:hypothetical protein
MTTLKQGTKVQIDHKGGTTNGVIGTIVGTAMSGYYIIQTDEPIKDYPYSTICVHDDYVKTIPGLKDYPLPLNAFDAKAAKSFALEDTSEKLIFRSILGSIFNSIDTATKINADSTCIHFHPNEFDFVNVNHELFYEIEERLEDLGYGVNFSYGESISIEVSW